MESLDSFRRVVCVDFEFHAPPGERPVPLCVCWRELRTGQLGRLWLLDDPPALPPYATGSDTLLVAYYSSAEWGCHLAIGWPMPARVLDLFAEFRNLTNGRAVPAGNGLLGALTYFGLDALPIVEKEQLRALAIRGAPFTEAERLALLDYCQSDVDALARLLPAMLPGIDIPRAVGARGRYMLAAARMEFRGIPLDVDLLARLRATWDRLKGRLLAAIDRDYDCFLPADERTLDPDTAFGSTILDEATRQGIDPRALAAAVEAIWREEREADAEAVEARRLARRATGLTQRRINLWEDAGKDSAGWPGLDGTARELAGELPALGIGRGYSADDGPDEGGYAERLWDLLRNHDERPKRRTDPDVIRRAVQWVEAYGNDAEALRYVGRLRFCSKRFAEYLTRRGMAWPRLESGALALDDDTLKEMARTYPDEIGPLRDALKIHRGDLKRIGLTVGRDGRNRFLLSAFRATTSRNAPSNAAGIFGPSAWMRSLIRPEPGRALAYVDWGAQELGIAAWLSGDARMQECYASGDPYMMFARMCGAVPIGATKATHGSERDAFKTVSLGVLFGLSADGLARKLDVPPCRGRELLALHKRTFPRFWEWSGEIETRGMLSNHLRTLFGWDLHIGPGVRPTSIRNFPMQANAAEMMRLAAILATERGIEVCTPVHDAFLIEADDAAIEAETERMRDAMREASELVLPGFPLRTDAKIVRHPDRFMDERGRRMFGTVLALLDDLERAETPSAGAGGWLEIPLAPALGDP